MAQRTRDATRVSATEQKFYIPAKATLPFLARQFERLRAVLLSHRV